MILLFWLVIFTLNVLSAYLNISAYADTQEIPNLVIAIVNIAIAILAIEQGIHDS